MVEGAPRSQLDEHDDYDDNDDDKHGDDGADYDVAAADDDSNIIDLFITKQQAPPSPNDPKPLKELELKRSDDRRMSK